jgi:hypothetical protein
MKFRVLILAAVTSLTLLSGCSDEPTAPTPDGSPSVPASPSDGTQTVDSAKAGAYQYTYNSFVTVIDRSRANGQSEATNAEEANRHAELNESTNLIFADYKDPKAQSTGSFCLEADNKTYISFTLAKDKGVFTLGEGDCSYDTDKAAIVGDFTTNEWTKGAELMGDILPNDYNTDEPANTTTDSSTDGGS